MDKTARSRCFVRIYAGLTPEFILSDNAKLPQNYPRNQMIGEETAMLRIPVIHARPGLITSRNIYHTNGNLLLGQDIVLDRRLLSRLGNMGIDSIYVKHPFSEERPPEILHEKTRVEAVRQVGNTFTQLRDTKVLNVAGLNNAVKMIIEDIIDNRDVLIHLTDVRVYDDYTFGHSVNVCLISTMIGLKMGMNGRELQEMAVGAILHDIGKMTLPLPVLNKKTPLTPKEWDLIRGHAATGFEILRHPGSIPLISGHVAFQHHENYDGTGYPRALSGEEIHRYARIAAVADLYDAITSDRPHRLAMLPHEAYEVILGSRGTKLDPEITDVFLQNVSLFPLGSVVALDTGEIGVVVKLIPKLQARPIIKIVYDRSGKNILDQPRLVDLTAELTRFIVKVFKPEEIAAMAANTSLARAGVG
ncbi:MAG: HD-GYP domain-containing protein [Negativicutes bacterium]|nr:HD-GYP domain-containing protein [Negativicutes bacterium]